MPTTKMVTPTHDVTVEYRIEAGRGGSIQMDLESTEGIEIVTMTPEQAQEIGASLIAAAERAITARVWIRALSNHTAEAGA